MGIIGMFSSCKQEKECGNPAGYTSPEGAVIGIGNPNPSNFEIIFVSEVGNYLVTEIIYPDCKNYEGHKVLMYKGLSKEELADMTSIDPHFCANHISPLARFAPTQAGRQAALVLAEELARLKF